MPQSPANGRDFLFLVSLKSLNLIVHDDFITDFSDDEFRSPQALLVETKQRLLFIPVIG
jgi:hypothetical protein